MLQGHAASVARAALIERRPRALASLTERCAALRLSVPATDGARRGMSTICRELNRAQHDTEALGGDTGPHGLGSLSAGKALSGHGGAGVRWLARAYHGCRRRSHGALERRPAGAAAVLSLRVRSTVSAPHQGGEDLKRPRASSSGGGSPRASGAPIWPIRGPRMTRISRAGRRNRHDSRRDEAPCSKVSSGKRHLRRGGVKRNN